jgi:PH domain
LSSEIANFLWFELQGHQEAVEMLKNVSALHDAEQVTASPPKMTGWFLKKLKIRGWKRRLLVLDGDSFTYKEKEGGKDLKKPVFLYEGALAKVAVQRDGETILIKKTGVAVQNKTYKLKPEDKTTIDAWVDAFEKGVLYAEVKYPERMQKELQGLQERLMNM